MTAVLQTPIKTPMLLIFLSALLFLTGCGGSSESGTTTASSPPPAGASTTDPNSPDPAASSTTNPDLPPDPIPIPTEAEMIAGYSAVYKVIFDSRFDDKFLHVCPDGSASMIVDANKTLIGNVTSIGSLSLSHRLGTSATVMTGRLTGAPGSYKVEDGIYTVTDPVLPSGGYTVNWTAEKSRDFVPGC